MTSYMITTKPAWIEFFQCSMGKMLELSPMMTITLHKVATVNVPPRAYNSAGGEQRCMKEYVTQSTCCSRVPRFTAICQKHWM